MDRNNSKHQPLSPLTELSTTSSNLSAGSDAATASDLSAIAQALHSAQEAAANPPKALECLWRAQAEGLSVAEQKEAAQKIADLLARFPYLQGMAPAKLEKDLTLNAEVVEVGQINTAQIKTIQHSMGWYCSGDGIARARPLTIIAEQLYNRRAKIQLLGPVTLQCKVIDNQHGTIVSTDQLKLCCGEIHNDQGALQGATGVVIEGNLPSGAGRVLSGGSFSFKPDQERINSANQVVANPEGASIFAAGPVWLWTPGQFKNFGTISSESELTVGAAQIVNYQNIYSKSHTKLLADTTGSGRIDNHGLINGAHTELRANAIANLGAGRLLGDQLYLGADIVTNGPESAPAAEAKSALIGARKKLTIGADYITNRNRASIKSDGALSIGGVLGKGKPVAIGEGAELNNNGGSTISFKGSGNFSVKRLDNQSGTIEQRDSEAELTLTAAELNNREGSFKVSGPVDLSRVKIENRGGTISSATELTIDGNKMANDNGTVYAGKQLIVGGGLPSGRGSKLLSDSTLRCKTSTSCTNRIGSTVYAKEWIDFQTGKIFTNHGTLSSGGELSVKADGIENHHDATINGTQVKLLASETTGGKLLNCGLIDGERTELHAATINNLTGGQLLGDKVHITASDFLKNEASKIGARSYLLVEAARTHNLNKGQIVSQDALNIGLKHDKENKKLLRANELINDDSVIEFRNGATLSANKISNQNGKISQTGSNSQGNNGGSVWISTQKLNNRHGAIKVSGPLALDNMLVDNRDGVISSSNRLSLGSNLKLADKSETIPAGAAAEKFGPEWVNEQLFGTEKKLLAQFGTLEIPRLEQRAQYQQELAEVEQKLTEFDARGYGTSAQDPAEIKKHATPVSQQDKANKEMVHRGGLFRREELRTMPEKVAATVQELIELHQRRALLTARLAILAKQQQLAAGASYETVLIDHLAPTKELALLRSHGVSEAPKVDKKSSYQAELAAVQQQIAAGGVTSSATDLAEIERKSYAELLKKEQESDRRRSPFLHFAQPLAEARAQRAALEVRELYKRQQIAQAQLAILEKQEKIAAVQGAKELTYATRKNHPAVLLNERGTLQAGESLTIQNRELSGAAGKLLSNGTLSLEAESNVTLPVGMLLEAYKEATLAIKGQLSNYGTIDGKRTEVRARTINNHGDGVLSGDDLLIGATTLNNSPEDNPQRAPMILARNHLTIGIKEAINNSKGAVIYSGGKANVGRVLTPTGELLGQAPVINNESATIDISGDADLDVANIYNRNLNFKAQPVEVSRKNNLAVFRFLDGRLLTEYDFEHSHRIEDIKRHRNYPAFKYLNCQHMPNVKLYHISRVVSETKVISSDPAKLRIGGKLKLSGNLHNDKSQLDVGSWAGNSGGIEHTDVEGFRTTIEDGYFTRPERRWLLCSPPTSFPLGSSDIESRGLLGRFFSLMTIISNLHHAETREEITVSPLIEGSTSSLRVIPQRQALTQATADTLAVPTGGALAVPGRQDIVQFPSQLSRSAAETLVVRTTLTTLELPSGPLFKLLQVTSGTTSYQMLVANPLLRQPNSEPASAYLLRQFPNPGNLPPLPFGDSFSEQRTLRARIMKITGMRRLAGCSSDEQMIRALVENGVRAGKTQGLILGERLTASQIDNLTGDMVWLERRRVQFADGSQDEMLVPQLYIVAPASRPLPSTAVLSADHFVFQGESFENRYGTVFAYEIDVDVDNFSSELGNIHAYRNRIRAKNIDVDTANISGERQLLVTQVGKDGRANFTGKAVVTTVGEPGKQGPCTTRTSLTPANISLTRTDGELEIDAEGNANFSLVRIANMGRGRIHGRNVTFDTVKAETRDDRIDDANNYRKSQSEWDVGCQIASVGNMEISADGTLEYTALQVRVGLPSGSAASAFGIPELPLPGIDTPLQLPGAETEQGTANRVPVLGMPDTEAPFSQQLVAPDNSQLSATSGQTGKLTVRAKNVIARAGRASHTSETSCQYTESCGFLGLGKRTVTKRQLNHHEQAIPSILVGTTAEAKVDGRIESSGSLFLGEQGTKVSAKELVLDGALQKRLTEREQHICQSGISFSGGSLFIGTQQFDATSREEEWSEVKSVIGSLFGDTVVEVADIFLNKGGRILAPRGNNTIDAGQLIDEFGHLTRQIMHESHSESNGLTIGVSQPLLVCTQSLEQFSNAAIEGDNPQTLTIASLGSALAVYNAYDAVKFNPNQLGGISGGLSFGEQSSSSSSWMRQEIEQPGEFRAGDRLYIKVRDKDLKLKSTLTAAEMNLSGKNIAITSASSKLYSTSQQESSSSSFGVNITIGSGGSLIPMPTIGFGEGEADGREVAISYHNDPVECSGTINVETAGNFSSSRTINAHKISGSVESFTLESRQDSNQQKHNSQNTNVTLGANSNTATAALNHSFSHIKSDYLSVTDQTQLNVKAVQLNIANVLRLIGSALNIDATEGEDNYLSVGAVVAEELANHSSLDARAGNIGVAVHGKIGGASSSQALESGTSANSSSQDGGAGTNQQGQITTGTDMVPGTARPRFGNSSAIVPIFMSASESHSSTTRSTILGSQYVVINKPELQQRLTGQTPAEAIANLSGAAQSNSLTPLLTGKKLSQLQASMKAVELFSHQVNTCLQNQVKKIEQKIEQAADLEERANNSNPAEQLKLLHEASQLRSQAAELESTWGMGGKGRIAMTSLSLAAGSNITAGLGHFVQAATVNVIQSYGANHVKQLADKLGSEPARAAMHSLLAAAGAVAQGGDAASAAIGASASVALNNLAAYVYGADAANLNAEERQACRNIVTSIIGGVAEGLGLDAASANVAATIETENNSVFVPPIELLLPGAAETAAATAAFIKWIAATAGPALAALAAAVGPGLLYDKYAPVPQSYRDADAIIVGPTTKEQILANRGPAYLHLVELALAERKIYPHLDIEERLEVVEFRKLFANEAYQRFLEDKRDKYLPGEVLGFTALAPEAIPNHTGGNQIHIEPPKPYIFVPAEPLPNRNEGQMPEVAGPTILTFPIADPQPTVLPGRTIPEQNPRDNIMEARRGDDPGNSRKSHKWRNHGKVEAPVAEVPPQVLQSGGHDLEDRTARELNRNLGTNYHPKELGDALEALKKHHLLPNDHHGKIMSNGDYVDKIGNAIDNIKDYL